MQINNIEQEIQSQQNTESVRNRNKSNVFYLGGILFLIFLFIISTYFVSKYHKYNLRFNFPSSPAIPTRSEVNSNFTKNVVEKVGNENIYNEELDIEYANYPLSRSASVTKQLLAKIARDSIILQAGSAEGLITLDARVFNSPNVDYRKRIQLIKTVENAIASKENKLSGSFISIWFDNVSPGPAGYEQGKQIAYAAISQLYTQVKENNMTMDQVAQAIKDNIQLAQVDPQYKSNAISVFSAGPTDKITYDPAFDAMIRTLSPGQLTPLYLAKDKDGSGKVVDAVYMFAQVTTKTTTGQNETFEQWYAQKKSHYEITIY